MPQRVLVIDDCPEIHRLLAARLRPEDLTLTSILHADEGLRAAAEDPPDLILLDVDMPEMTGFALCEALKADSRTATVPIIFLTAAGTLDEKVRGFDLGAVDYITKPFEPAELRARVRAALRTKRYQDLLAARAQTDAMTGLWNRAYFERRLREELDALHRYRRPLAIVLLDIDHFKQINDTHGHPFGDRAIQAVADVLAAGVRSTDAVCRYGGEEFAAILSETPGEGGRVTAERMRARLDRLALTRRDAPVPITASFGVASSDWQGPEVGRDALVAAADAALYAAKRAGRNCVRTAAPAPPHDLPAALLPPDPAPEPGP